MLKIGAFAALSSISIHMLRNYDKIGLLVPVYTDETSGYRYYDKEQLVQANHIIALKTMGFGLEEIKKIMIQPVNDVDRFLRQKLKSKRSELEDTRKQINQLEFLLDTDKNTEKYSLQIIKKTMPPMWAVSLSGQIGSYPDEGIMWGNLGSACRKNHIAVLPDAPAIAIYRGIDLESGKLQIEVRFPIEKKCKAGYPLQVLYIEEQTIASVMFQGSYSQIYLINTAVAQWLENNHLEIAGQAFTIYHRSPGNCTDEKDFITELCFPVK